MANIGVGTDGTMGECHSLLLQPDLMRKRMEQDAESELYLTPVMAELLDWYCLVLVQF